jgi:hypothetical protein
LECNVNCLVVFSLYVALIGPEPFGLPEKIIEERPRKEVMTILEVDKNDDL